MFKKCISKIFMVFLLTIFSLSANGLVFQDGSISIMPIWPPQIIQSGYSLQAMDIYGYQNQIKIIDQTLDTFIPNFGVVNNSDSIVQGLQKLAASADTNYAGLHIISGSSTTTNLTAFQRGVIIDPGITGKTIILPSANASGVIPWKDYPIIVGGGVITSNTIGVPSGNYINNTLNGIYTLTGLLSGWLRVNAVSDGSKWFITP